MKIVVTGARGMLGSDVVARADEMSHEVVALDRDDLDVTDPGRVERLIVRERPGAVINCAAWTKVDLAEDHESDAELVNGRGAGFVADAAAKAGAMIVYPSTDYVFDGTKKGPYTESDEPNPIQAYGRSKLAGERATAHFNKRSFIVRTSWLFGTGGGNFVETMLRLGEGGGPVVVVHDQVGCPTYTGHLAAGVLRLIDGSAFGVHHMAGAGSCSWYEFAMEIFRQSEVVTRVMSSTSDMMERPAKRPANSVLGSGREAPIQLPDWKRGLADYLQKRDEPEPVAVRRPRAADSTVRRQPVLELHSRDEGEGADKGDPPAEGSDAPQDEAPSEETSRSEEES
jgi:dTDP-4-dehydrorhamnose reductase